MVLGPRLNVLDLSTTPKSNISLKKRHSRRRLHIIFGEIEASISLVEIKDG
jgi:hypothetical protein